MRPRRLEAHLFVTLCALSAAPGCRQEPQAAEQGALPTELQTPSQPGSGEPNLTVTADGAFLLSWIEPAGEGVHALRHSRREAGGEWGAPGTVASGDDWFVNWADFPSLAAFPDGTLAAHWLRKSGPGTFAYDVRLALSRDGGTSWSHSIVPHRDGKQTEHGFVSMASMEADSLGVIWLDGRNMVGDEGQEGHGGSGDEMALMFTSLTPGGDLGEETLLDPRVCECCQTGMARTDRGLLAVYRDRSQGEVRDISYVRRDDEGWSEPRTLVADGWEINGCPVNGPSIAANGLQVAVAWFTAPEEQGRVSVVLSEDGGDTWGAPVRVDDGEPIGRVDVVQLAGGEALVSWLEQVEDGAQLKVRRVGPEGPAGPSLRIADSGSSRSSGFPRMATSGREVVFAWRDRADPPQVRTALLELH